MCLIWLAASAGFAQTSCGTAKLLPERSFFLNLGPFACVLEDRDLSYELDNILTSDLSDMFEPVPTGLVDFGFRNSRFWVRTTLQNEGQTTGTWWITHDMPIFEKMRVRLVSADGSVENLLLLEGNAPFGARTIPHRHLVSSITLLPGQQAELVIDYVTGLGTQMPLFAESIDQFVERTQTEMSNHLMLIAALLGMGLISTLYFYSLEGPAGLIYGAYVLSAAGFLFNAESYGFQFLYPNAVEFYRNAYPVLGLCTMAFGTWFIGRLTLTRNASRLLNWTAVASVAILLFLIVTAPLFLSFAWYKVGSLAASVFANVAQVAIIFSALRRRQSGAWLLLVAFVITGIAIAFTMSGYVTKGLFPQEMAGSAMRLGFFLEGVAYSGAIALRIRDARRARDRSLRDQLRLTQESLRLSKAVQQAEAERQEAEREAYRSRIALSSAAHDIRQPLTSLQMLVAEGKSDVSHITGSLNYIEDIIAQGLSPVPLGAESPDPVGYGAKELFSLALVINNIEAMFASEAQQRGVDLRVVSSTLHVVIDPLSLMRITSNLVSNALKHAQARRIVVGCRRSSKGVRIEVHDNGRGMTSDALSALAKRGAKGPESSGHGLGLAIVQELADLQEIKFELTSTPGRGTAARIFISNEAETS